MTEYDVYQTVTFHWKVNANSEKEAMEISEDMGEIGSTSSFYTSRRAIKR